MYLAILVTGVLGALIHPTVINGVHLPDLGYLAWLFLVPLFLILPFLNLRSAFAASLSSAILTYALGLYWLIPAMVEYGGVNPWSAMGILGLIVLILSFGFGGAIFLALWTHRKIKVPFFIAAAAFLMCFEYARTYFPVNGFPWIQAAYSQGKFLGFFQWVDSTGVYGLNLLIWMVNGLIAEMILPWIQKTPKDKAINRAAILVLCVLISFFAGIYRQHRIEGETRSDYSKSVALIQANISQALKWDADRESENLSRHLELSNLAEKRGAELAIWPEASYPYPVDLKTAPQFQLFETAGGKLPAILLGAAGIEQVGTEEVLYNSAFLTDDQSRITDFYHKRHLVPFGEYVPLKRWLTFARRLTTAVGDFSPGAKANPFISGDLKMGVLICYEDIFPDLARQSVREGANILVNITNDAWYGDTSAQHQHLIFSQFRALETRRTLLRATNTGMTAWIDWRGVVLKSLPPFEPGVLLLNAIPQSMMSPYVRYGDWIAWMMMGVASLLVLGALVAVIRSARSDRAASDNRQSAAQ